MPKAQALSILKQWFERQNFGKSRMSYEEIETFEWFLTRGAMARIFVEMFGLDEKMLYKRSNNQLFVEAIIKSFGWLDQSEVLKKLEKILEVVSALDSDSLWIQYKLYKGKLVETLVQLIEQVK